MHTRSISTLLVGIMLALLGASASAQNTEITLLHCWVPPRTEWVDDMIVGFEAANPGIKVTSQVVGCGNTLSETFVVAHVGGAAPDVVMVHSLDLPAFVEMGALAPLSDFRQRDGISLDTWYPSEIESARWKGALYGFPIRTGGDANTLLFYNKEVFRETGLDPESPPETWGEMDEISSRLTRYEDDRIARAAVRLHGNDVTALSGWLSTNNADLYSEDGRTVRFADAEGIDVVEFLHGHFSSRYNGGLAELESFITSAGGFRSALAHGQLAMHVSGSWEFSLTPEVNPDIDLGVSLRPTSSRNVGAPGIHGGTFHYAISTQTENAEASWRLLQWLTINEAAGHFMLRQGRPSPLIAFNQHPDYARINEGWYRVGEALARVRTLSSFPFSRDVIGIFNQAIVQAVRGDGAVRTVMTEAAARSQALMNEYWANQ